MSTALENEYDEARAQEERMIRATVFGVTEAQVSGEESMPAIRALTHSEIADISIEKLEGFLERFPDSADYMREAWLQGIEHSKEMKRKNEEDTPSDGEI